jgi:hypothetical protein
MSSQFKKPFLGIFWRALEWKILVYFGPFRIFYDNLVILWSFCRYICRFGTVYVLRNTWQPCFEQQARLTSLLGTNIGGSMLWSVSTIIRRKFGQMIDSFEVFSQN